jgi:hypothetical protein
MAGEPSEKSVSGRRHILFPRSGTSARQNQCEYCSAAMHGVHARKRNPSTDLALRRRPLDGLPRIVKYEQAAVKIDSKLRFN